MSAIPTRSTTCCSSQSSSLGQLRQPVETPALRIVLRLRRQSSASPHSRQLDGCSERISRRISLRISRRATVSVVTSMPSATSVLQASGYPRAPSISTVHRRQPPNGESSLCEHSEGT